MTHHRFKVQRRVDVMARGHNGRRFLFAHSWQTLDEADSIGMASRLYAARKVEQPGVTFRIGEQPKPLADIKPVFAQTARPVTREFGRRRRAPRTRATA